MIICARDLWMYHCIDEHDNITVQSSPSYLEKAAEALEKLDCGILLVRNCAKYIRYLKKLQENRRKFDSNYAVRLRLTTIACSCIDLCPTQPASH